MSGPAGDQQRILSASAVMAAGTVVSRLSGFLRSTLLAAALGNLLQADVFNIANTIPNMLYILLAGGIFNAVLVPQLVRATRQDPDGGDAYANRVVTLAALFLGGVTVALVVAAPWLMALFLDPSYADPALAAQRASVVDLARYCLPQVFFYGMFVLVGQILNARGRFGPMMWAPIANNVISVLVLVIYLLAFGPARDLCGGFGPRQELLLGLSSTLGIAAQFLILVPYLRAAGFRYSPRLDFRNAGLGHTLRLGVWTVLFVAVNQVAYTVVVRLASGGTAAGAAGGPGACQAAGAEPGTGYAVYASAFLLAMVPHSVVTVSLATAILPRLSARAADGDLTGLAATLAGTLRTALCVIGPFAALLPLVASDVSNVVWGYGAARDTFELYAPTLALFAPAIVLFTVHYLMLRGLYALELTRAAFWVQCVIAATNVAVAVLLVGQAAPVRTAPALVGAYAASYAVGSLLSYLLLHRLLGTLETGALARFLGRLVLATGPSTLVAYAALRALRGLLEAPGSGPPAQWVAAGVVASVVAVDAVVFLALARLLRIGEVTSVVGLVTRRTARR